MAGFRGFQRNFDGFLVAHFADQDYFRRLPQRGAQCQREAGRVAVKFALMNRAFLVLVQELDGIFDGQDVVGLFVVDLINDRGQRGRFAGTGRSRDQHDAVAHSTNFAKLRAANSAMRNRERLLGITRITMAQVPRCINIFTRNRAIPGRL